MAAIPCFAEAISQLLVSNGVTLKSAQDGQQIFTSMANGLEGRYSQTQVPIDDLSKAEEQCKNFAKVMGWPSEVTNPIKILASAQPQHDTIICQGGCGGGSQGGLFVFVTMVYKIGSKMECIVMHTNHNISIAPEEIQTITCTVEPVVVEIKETVKKIGRYSEKIRSEKTIDFVVTRTTTELSNRKLSEQQLRQLRDFCLAKVCQQWLTRERACQMDWSDVEVGRILTFDFSKST